MTVIIGLIFVVALLLFLWFVVIPFIGSLISVIIGIGLLFLLIWFIVIFFPFSLIVVFIIWIMS